MCIHVCVMNQTDELIIMKAPLKAILKNFLDHVDDLEARRKLFDDQYESEFQELKKLTDKLKEDPAYSSSFGLKDVNRPKNRYKDIVPYDFSRVILPKHEGIPGADYINASYIKGASGALAYIAAQGPLPNTVMDFWRMIWICDVQVLVMACNEREAGKFKCEVYWPEPGEIKQYGNISIQLVRICQVCPDFLVRTFLVKCGSELRDVFQYHYTSWPDHGVPDTVQPILDLVRLIRDCQASETVPIVVHCSAGCGRTGTICAVDYVWACLRHGKLDEDFSLYQIALELRRQRIAMIQTKEQYILAHKAVAAMFEQQLKVIDCHIYENLDEDGEPLIWKEVGKGKEFDIPDFMVKYDTKEKPQLTPTDTNKSPVENQSNSKCFITSAKTEKTEESSIGSISHNSSVDNNLNVKANALDCVNSSSKNSESSYSRNSILSQQSNEDSIPFIDDDDVCVRPNCGRAYLDIPSCDSISKLVNYFDPFVDKVSIMSDDSSPDGDPIEMFNKIKEFQSLSSIKILDKNAKISSLNDSKCGTVQVIKQVDSRSDIFDSAKKSLLLNNRESYPPSATFEKFQKNLAEVVVEKEINGSSEGAKKIGKATVVRRPSISKLKALFEKSGISSQKGSNEGSKRLLFRNNSHHVSRAGSAPPSLDCMDKNSAIEKESILRLVTRKFRSSSVRTEREMQSQQREKTLNRKSATETVKDGFNALTRTMSFSINKTFKSYSPAKIKPESNRYSSASNTSDSIVGIYKLKSPDQPKGNSMWYDKSSLPRAVAVVKPTGKFEAVEDMAIATKSPDKNKSHETHFNYITKPTKLKDFFSSLNKKDSKDSTTFWYNEPNTDTPVNTENNIPDFAWKPDNTNSSTKLPSKVLPFLPIVPWKKVGRSPLSSPDSPKSLIEPTTPRSSTFYTNVLEADSTAVSSSAEKLSNVDVPKCPVPEEIIPLNINSTENKFWPSNSLPSTLQSTNSEKSDSAISVNKDSITEQSVNIELAKGDCNVKSAVKDIPPAIPKKLVIGKNKNLQNTQLDIVESPCIPMQQETNDNLDKSNTEVKPSNDESMKPCAIEEKNDRYINVNIKAQKNIEQIENVLRKNPRGAIIDLTSRESYSMEEELVNAVNQLSESSGKTKASEQHEKSKTLGAKNNSKFPGYEVIWPEQPCIPIQKSKSSSKVPLVNRAKLTDKGSESSLSNEAKTGLCYSPPLRRSVNASLELAKSQSCGNLDWLEPDDSISGIKEQQNTPTKRLVNEAVVELNTLLNQLTTRTLSEDVDFESKSKEKPTLSKETHKEAEKPIVSIKAHKKDEKLKVSKEAHKKDDNPKEFNIEPNDTVVHSVTLVTKSYNSGSSPKEEEIVFHFPPPPRVPPPKDEFSAESFSVVCKGRSLVAKESEDENPPCAKNKRDSKTVSLESSFSNSSDSCLDETCSQKFPQPAPRKSKQTTGLRRSSSYTNISPPQNKNNGYENIFLEKYQTLSRLEIKPENKEPNILDKIVPFQKSPLLRKIQNSTVSPNYVNIGDIHSTSVSGSQYIKSATFMNLSEPVKNKESVNNSVSDSNNQTSHGKSMMLIDDSHSVYGKIFKISDRKGQVEENVDIKNINSVQDVDVKKKPIHSKKTERAPLPPNIKQVNVINNEMAAKMSPNNSMIPKKLPSRKLEKAPLPPHFLQKSFSTMNVPQKNLIGPQPYGNFAAVHQSEEKSKLPAVHENVPNVTESAQMPLKNVNTSVVKDKFVNQGLLHSQSDVSVYLALKERRIQSVNQERKLLNMKSLLMNKKTKKEAVNMSSSDSDSSFERVFLTKDEPMKTSSKFVPKEQIEQLSIKTYRKEIPVAPPRSKRRSTTEVQYTKVKAKDVLRTTSSTSKLLAGNEIKNTKIVSSASDDNPPAIPVKTRDTFEIPEI